MKSVLSSILLLVITFGCQTNEKKLPYQTEQLKVQQLTENTFLHISYLETEDFGKVASNGMVVVNNGEAVIFDTPADDKASEELIEWVEDKLKATVKAVIVTHFHTDCLGGLKAFHEHNIPSYANNKTIDLAKLDNKIPPQNGMNDYFEIEVGSKKIINRHFGEGHTKDNIVSYFPDEEVLFGGCLIKGEKAGKGYLGDANIEEWSNTVQLIKGAYPNLKIVIPGHGKPEGQNLLDYTIEMFRKD